MSLFVEARKNGRGLLLVHCAGVIFKGESITQESLFELEDAQKWQGHAIRKTLEMNDGTLLQKLIYDYIPLTIIGDHREELVTLDAELARFPDPDRVDGRSSGETFAVRLIPITGRIARIILNASNLGVNYLDNEESRVSLGLGDGRLHLEAYYQSPGTNTLPPLAPFRRPRIYERDDIKRVVVIT